MKNRSVKVITQTLSTHNESEYSQNLDFLKPVEIAFFEFGRTTTNKISIQLAFIQSLDFLQLVEMHLMV